MVLSAAALAVGLAAGLGLRTLLHAPEVELGGPGTPPATPTPARAGVVLRGTVVGPTGEPVAGCVVELAAADGPEASAAPPPDPLATTLTGGDGRFVVRAPAPPDAAVLRLVASEWVPMECPLEELDREEDIELGTLELLPGTRVQVTVRDTVRDPLPGARLCFECLAPATQVERRARGAARIWGQCDDGGRLTTPPLHPGRYRLRLEAAGDRPSSPRPTASAPITLTPSEFEVEADAGVQTLTVVAQR
ncbi:MAG: carboxypeptidase-like regulatory domain-containing protein [Planctomycetota bacterium]